MKFDSFDPEQTTWEGYIERFEMFLATENLTTAAAKRAALLSSIGQRSFDALRDMAAPDKLSSMSYDRIVKMAAEHFVPTLNKFAARQLLEKRNRRKGELFQDYLRSIKNLAVKCQFGSNLEERLVERIISGCPDRELTERIMNLEEQSYAVVIKLCMHHESVKEATSSSVNHVSSQNRPRQFRPFKQSQRPTTSRSNDSKPCFRCLEPHDATTCKYKEWRCNYCKKIGHIVKACLKLKEKERQQSKSKKVQQIAKDEDQSDEEEMAMEEYQCYSVNMTSDKKSRATGMVTLEIGDKPVEFMVDTGSEVTIMNTNDFELCGGKINSRNKPLILRAYSGDLIDNLGFHTVNLKYGTQTLEKFPVVVSSGCNLLGRDLLHVIKLDWHAIFSTEVKSVKFDIDNYKDLFTEPITDVQVSIPIMTGQTHIPKCKARPVPMSMIGKVEDQIRSLVSQGIWVKTECTDYSTPLVTVLKADGSVRLCGSYDVTINKLIDTSHYNIPCVNQNLSYLSGCEVFSKVDLKQAYHQILLSEESKPYTIVNTHLGRFQSNRLEYGMSPAGGIFCEVIENIINSEFTDRSGIAVQYDDIIIGGANRGEHDSRLKRLLDLFLRRNVKLNENKCKFSTDSVEFMGYIVSTDGIQIQPGKLKVIEEAKPPGNVSELRSFLGFVNFLLRFIPNLATILQPLNKLLKKGCDWNWGDEEDKVFKQIKELVGNHKTLIPYSTTLPIHLMVDASPTALGGCLFHQTKSEGWKPVGFASRVLSPCEQRYSQFEREALACAWGVQKFHQYLYGRSFTLHSDHKPLLGVFDNPSQVVSPRVLRWCVTLGAYNFKLVFVKGTENFTDWLSRYVTTKEQTTEVPVPADMLVNAAFLESELRLTPGVVMSHQGADSDLKQVRKYIQEGWPPESELTASLKRYCKSQVCFSLMNDCLWYEDRIIIPRSLVEPVLNLLHEVHSGIVSTKELARRHFWWPSMATDIETFIKECLICQTHAKAPPKTMISPWQWPGKPWSRLHIDHFGPYMGKSVFIVIDSHTKWIDAQIHKTETTQAVIKSLQSLFKTFGLCNTIVSDNGSCFTSAQFKEFCLHNGIKHLTIAPKHPSSNGQAERAVGIVKGTCKKLSGTLQEKLEAFTYRYSMTVQSTTGQTPFMLMFGRERVTKFDVMKPTKKITGNSTAQGASAIRELEVQQQVWYRNFGIGPKWMKGTITRRTGYAMYEVSATDNKQLNNRHIDQLRPA